MRDTLTAAVVQMRSTTRMADNVEAMRALVGEAAKQGAGSIQTPEMTGLVQRDRPRFFETIRTEDDCPFVAAAADLAREAGVTLHVGSTPVLVGEGRAANRALVFGPDGRVLARYDKIHMFDVDLDRGERWRESAVYRPGERAVLVTVAGARTGLGICYDMRFPELAMRYARAGAEVLTFPSCFTRQTGEAHWHLLTRARAVENGAFVIAAAQGGTHEDGRETFGHSLIVDPWGAVIAEIANDAPGVALADIRLAAVGEARAKVPNLANGRAFTLDDRTMETGSERAA